MGESTNPRATLRFDRRIRLEFHGATITSDAGLLACRELDDVLGLTETASECLQESRGGRNVQHRLVGLLRQSVYSRLAGYEDTNDAERLAQDPTMRVIVGRRGGPEETGRQHQHHEPVRDRGAYPRRQCRRVGPSERYVGGPGDDAHSAPAGDLGHGQFGESGTGGQEGASYKDTLGARAITLCSCSTSSVTARGRCSVRGTYIARTGGVMYWIRSCPATGRQECGGTFVPMPHSPSRTSMSTSRSGTSFTL